ncbi:MAG: hypothetical protein IKO25_03990 [Clostridia bacterium]|nr:hypothetical protein [Clostridia bacterium]
MKKKERQEAAAGKTTAESEIEKQRSNEIEKTGERGQPPETNRSGTLVSGRQKGRFP